jgi:hypothetical protein
MSDIPTNTDPEQAVGTPTEQVIDTANAAPQEGGDPPMLPKMAVLVGLQGQLAEAEKAQKETAKAYTAAVTDDKKKTAAVGTAQTRLQKAIKPQDKDSAKTLLADAKSAAGAAASTLKTALREKDRAEKTVKALNQKVIAAKEAADKEAVENKPLELVPVKELALAAQNKMAVTLRTALTKVGLVPGSLDGLTFDELMFAADQFDTAVQAGPWAVGDLILATEAKHGEKYHQLESVFGIGKQQLQNIVSVCRAFSMERRRDEKGMTFTHHEMTQIKGIKPEQQDTLLDVAVYNSGKGKPMTTGEFGKEINKFKEDIRKAQENSGVPGQNGDGENEGEGGDGATVTLVKRITLDLTVDAFYSALTVEFPTWDVIELAVSLIKFNRAVNEVDLTDPETFAKYANGPVKPAADTDSGGTDDDDHEPPTLILNRSEGGTTNGVFHSETTDADREENPVFAEVGA